MMTKYQQTRKTILDYLDKKGVPMTDKSATTGLSTKVLERFASQDVEIKGFDSLPLTLSSDEDKGFTTGWSKLDKLSRWKKKEVNALVAPTKAGKTTWSLAACLKQAQAGRPVFIASFEITKQEVYDIMLSMIAEQHREKIRETSTLEHHANRLQALPIYIADSEDMDGMAGLEAHLTSAVVKKQVEFVLIDHLHFIESHTNENFAYQLDDMIKAIKKMAKELNVCILLIVQPRETAGQYAYDHNSIKGSSSIKQVCDAVWSIDKVHGKRLLSKLSLHIHRHRRATPGTLCMRYNHDKLSYTEEAYHEYT